MNQLISTTEVQTMSSREIAELTGKQHYNVIRDIENMLNALNLEQNSFLSFVNDGPNGRGLKVYNLPKEETLILVSGYNVQMRAAIIRRWQELEEQQAKQLSTKPDCEKLIATAISAIESITQAALKVITEINTLPAQQQHTEPVQALPPTVGVHNPCPANKISLNKMKNYVSNETLLKELINGFGLVGELFDPGCVEGTNKAARPYMVYNKNQVAAMLKAAQVLADKIEGGKRRLLGRTFSVKTNVAPHLYDGFDFDAACEMILLLKAKQC